VFFTHNFKNSEKCAGERESDGRKLAGIEVVGGVMSELNDLREAILRLSAAQRAVLADWIAGVSPEEPSSTVAEARGAYVSPEQPMTLEDYFAHETRSRERHEYLNGALYAMSGASVAHNQITFQLAKALSARLQGGSCQVFLADLKLRLALGEDRIVYYPDVMVACQPERWGRDSIAAPRVVVEVLSPTTRHIDLREKALNYRREPSIEDYVILWQDECRARVHRRAQHWSPEHIQGAEAMLALPSLGIELPLADVYAGVLGLGERPHAP
jgi:Uma2 family endonuclease